jgi:hypothetical protein
LLGAVAQDGMEGDEHPKSAKVTTNKPPLRAKRTICPRSLGRYCAMNIFLVNFKLMTRDKIWADTILIRATRGSPSHQKLKCYSTYFLVPPSWAHNKTRCGRILATAATTANAVAVFGNIVGLRQPSFFAGGPYEQRKHPLTINRRSDGNGDVPRREAWPRAYCSCWRK